jgi:hypothetical protein
MQKRIKTVFEVGGETFSVIGTGQEAATEILRYAHQDRKNRKVAILKGFLIPGKDEKGEDKETFIKAVK